MGDSGIAFGRPTNTSDSTDETFLRSVVWRPSADRKMRAAGKSGDTVAFCEALRRTLRKRRTSGCSSSSSSTRTSLSRLMQPLWSQRAWDDTETAERLSPLLFEIERRLTKRAKKPRNLSGPISKLVASSLDEVPPDVSPWAQVVWLTVLGEVGDRLDDGALLSLWRQTLVSVISAIDVEHRPGVATDGEFSDDRQLVITGELPWLAGLTFADVKGAGKAMRSGRKELQAQLEALTDGDGTPHATSLHRLPLQLAAITRSLSAAKAFGESLLKGGSADRFEDLVTRAAAMAQMDGRLALSNGASFGAGSLLQTASGYSGLSTKALPFRRLQGLADDLSVARDGKTKSSASSPRIKLPKVKRRPLRKQADTPSTQSDWAELACMRNNWHAGGDSCILAHHGVHPQLSVTAFERLLIDGDWQLEVEVDGTPLELTADWSCVCWLSDDDADYIELQQDAADGVTLLRQVLLSRTDHWLMLADTVKTPQARSIRMTSRLPLSDCVETSDNRWTRDLSLRCEKLKARVIPLALQQDRVHQTDGSLSVDGGQLVLSQFMQSRDIPSRSSQGVGLCMPLVMDWSPNRQKHACLWQPLTVAEDGQRLPPSVAAGQRLQIGKHQWVFFRSLFPGETARTMLGHHTDNETVIGEFSGDGEVEPIVLIESPDQDE